ncbi:hypothetical protein NC651_033580 [Populus alba x Populus x berolinensis]|nr:hypothetical protein NC651_033580 [Populus alba x Populus x berolinensis]
MLGADRLLHPRLVALCLVPRTELLIPQFMSRMKWQRLHMTWEAIVDISLYSSILDSKSSKSMSPTCSRFDL